MLWALIAVAAAAWASRTVMRGHDTWEWRAAAFGAGVAAGTAAAFMLGLFAMALADGGLEADEGFARVVTHFWWVAALGSAAGLVAAWRERARA